MPNAYLPHIFREMGLFKKMGAEQWGSRQFTRACGIG